MSSAAYSYQNVIEILNQLPAHLQQEIIDFAEFIARKHKKNSTPVEEAKEIYKLNSSQKKAVSKGLEDLKNKKVILDSTANKQMDEWLKSNFSETAV